MEMAIVLNNVIKFDKLLVAPDIIHFHFACLWSEIFLWRISNTLSSNPKGARSVDQQFFTNSYYFFCHWFNFITNFHFSMTSMDEETRLFHSKWTNYYSPAFLLTKIHFARIILSNVIFCNHEVYFKIMRSQSSDFITLFCCKIVWNLSFGDLKNFVPSK